MRAPKNIIVGLICLLLVPTISSGHPEPNRALAKRIAKLETRIQELEARIVVREDEPGNNWKKMAVPTR